jgi:uncharacterized membrane protein
MRLMREIVVDRPRAVVFAYLADPRNLPAWQRSVSSVEAPERVGLGSTFTEARSIAGKRALTTLEVVDYEPDRLFSLRAVHGRISGSVRHELREDGERTTVRVEIDADLDALPRLARPLVSRVIKDELGRDLARLKALLEGA